VPPEELAIEFPSGTLRTRTAFRSAFARAYLPVETAGAEVLARGPDGRPALCRHAVGKGQVIFFAYPWEFYLGEQPDVNGRDESHALYAWLGARARGRFAASDPRVQTHVARAKTEDLVWAINRSWDAVEARVDAPGSEKPYAPKEARLLRVPR